MKILAWPNSSQIHSTKYIPDTETLEVEFKTGGIYQYFKVPQATWDALEAAQKQDRAYSVGYWLNSTIKGKFEYLKIK